MILVTGAAGFLGQALVARLLMDPDGPGLVLLDRVAGPAHPRVRWVTGSITDAAVREDALRTPPRTVFHLASVPGGAAERDQARGRSVNLDATLAVLEALAARRDVLPTFVFASSIAVYGAVHGGPMAESAAPQPLLTYGAHKLMGEIAVADSTRRGAVDGRSLRLCGIVARPPAPNGAISIFFSDLIRDLPRGVQVTVPMRAEATTWLMSVVRCVDNLLHAARMEVGDGPRVWTPPPLRVSISALVDAVGAAYGRDLRPLVRYAPDAAIEAAFGNYPDLDCARSRAAGFRGDEDVRQMITAAV